MAAGSRAGRLGILGLLVGSLTGLIAYGGMVRLGDLRAQTIPFLWLFGLAFAGYVAAVLAVRRSPRAAGGWTLRWIMVAAIAFRLIALLLTPTLSDDVYRYAWDGRMTGQGINPYLHAPDSPALTAYRDSLWPLINHPEIPTPYPPVSQGIFALVVWVGHLVAPSPIAAMQVAALAFDLATIALIIRLLAHLGRPREQVLNYAWHPLVVVELIGNAHHDAAMIAGILLALWLTVKAIEFRNDMDAGREPVSGGRGWTGALAGVALAAAVLVKWLPLLILPVVWRHWTWRARLAFAGALVALTLPFLEAGSKIVSGGFLTYAERWKWNDGLFYWLVEVLRPVAADPTFPAKIAIALPIAAFAAWSVVRRPHPARAGPAMLWRSFVLIGLYIVVTPTVHPWYVTWVIPFLVFFPSPGWIWLTGAVALFNLTYTQPGWRQLDWVRIVEYVPLYLWLAYAAQRSIRRWLVRRRSRSRVRRAVATAVPTSPPG